MGVQESNIGDITGASVIIIEQTCENTQLLVSLCRNEIQWLSPVGWTNQKKITLLDCRSRDGKTEIDIPAEFAKTLVAGDKLLLKCSELDLTQDIVWAASHLQTRPVLDMPPSASRGLLSRFKLSKASDKVQEKSEAERRAEDADRAAQAYRAKMEAATAAKEEAQQKALEAAREAEAALKMEAERIAEMERAAKAFEEAERFKQDELRRIEEERRAEEARLAEEARRIEEARKREAEAKVEAERKAALERYISALDDTQNEESRLQTRLDRLTSDGDAFETQKSENTVKIEALNGELITAHQRADKSRGSFEKTAGKLDDVTTDLSKLQRKSDALSSEKEGIEARLGELEADYVSAQKEAEMALARAEEKRKSAEIVRLEKETAQHALTSLSRDLDVQARFVNDVTVKLQKLQSKSEAAQADLSQKTAEKETLESDINILADRLQTNRIEIEATRQAVEDCQERQKSHQDAIAHLEGGGRPDTLVESKFEPSYSSKKNIYFNDLNKDNIAEGPENMGLFGRVKRNLLRNIEAEISIDVQDVHLDERPVLENDRTEEILLDVVVDDDADTIEDTIKNEPVREELSQIDDIAQASVESKGFLRRHRRNFLAIGTILSGAAILGAGYLLSKPQSETLTVKSSTPAQLSKVNATGLELDVLSPPIMPSVTQASVSDKIAPEILSVTTAEKPVLDTAKTELPPIPNLTLTGLSVDNVAAKIETKTDVVKEAALETPKTIIEPPQKPALKAANEKAPAESTPKMKNYPELTTRIQKQLQTLGFYSGSLNGQQTAETQEAIRTFKELYGLPKNSQISGKFLTALGNAEAQHKAAQKYAVVRELPLETIPTQSVPTETVLTQTLPSTQTYNDPQISVGSATPIISQEVSVPKPTLTAPSASSVIAAEPKIEVASAAPSIPPVQDVIVEAQRTRAAKAIYPKNALSKNYFVDARIVVAYDIDTLGEVTNIRIVSNDHEGRFNSSFERAAKAAVRRQRFTPKTINGESVASTGHTQRIVFKAG